jgi:peptidase E
MCPTIEHVELVEHKEVVPELTDYSAIGLVKELLMPHAGREKYASRHAKMREIWGDRITFLTDDQAVIVNNDKTEIVTI